MSLKKDHVASEKPSNLMTGDWGGKSAGSINEKPLKQMTINEGKNRQIEIGEKPPNLVRTEEENRS